MTTIYWNKLREDFIKSLDECKYKCTENDILLIDEYISAVSKLNLAVSGEEDCWGMFIYEFFSLGALSINFKFYIASEFQQCVVMAFHDKVIVHHISKCNDLGECDCELSEKDFEFKNIFEMVDFLLKENIVTTVNEPFIFV